MNRDRIYHNTLKNWMSTLGLLSVMAAVTGTVAYMVAGQQGVWVALVALGLAFAFSGGINPLQMLRARGVRPLHPTTHFRLYALAAEIAKRAGLAKVPQLFIEPSKVMNAYATGNRENPVIVFTDTLLRNLDSREVAGILGHEIAHIKNNDLTVMALASSVQRVTAVISMFGQIALIFAIPLVLSGQVTLLLTPILFIVYAPTLVLLLQMAVSRTREFEADLVGVELTGDPAGLAQALYRLERYHRSYWRNFFLSPWARKAPSWLQTHPPTAQRIKRLMEMEDTRSTFTRSDIGDSAARYRVVRPAPTHGLYCINC